MLASNSLSIYSQKQAHLIMNHRSNQATSIFNTSQKKTIKKQANKANKKHDKENLYENQVNDSAAAQIIRHNVTQNLVKRMVGLIKATIKHLKYSIQTYFICLLILDRIKVNINQNFLRLSAFTIVLIASKFNQHQAPKFSKLFKWGKGEFQKQDLVLAEAKLLHLIDFQIPRVVSNLQEENQKQMIKLQKQLCSLIQSL